MCLSNEAVDELHAITSAIKAEHEMRDEWLKDLRDNEACKLPGHKQALTVTETEAERIFADRIAAHEARLKELGWSRVQRVDSKTEKA